MELTNKEIKQICETQQKMRGTDYPDWKFKITQTNTKIKIGWEYIDYIPWTIEKETLMVENEHGEFMNDELEFNGTLKEIITSIVYYMNTRY